MKFLSAMAMGLFLAPVLAAPQPFTEVIPEWEVQVHPDGRTITARGTIEQAVAAARAVNPDFDESFNITSGLPENTSVLDKRTVFDENTSTFTCQNSLPLTSIEAINDGIKYLKGVKGRPHLVGGSNVCSRVSCSYHAAIWWCNNDPNPKELWAFGSIADGASRIMAVCGGTEGPGQVRGSTKHNTQWTVKVGKGDC